jgi:hypothetical protein
VRTTQERYEELIDELVGTGLAALAREALEVAQSSHG